MSKFWRPFLILNLVVILLGCGQEPTVSPTKVPVAAPTITRTPKPEVVDIPMYKNGFEEMTDLSASGITSLKNEVRLNNENVAFQSGKQSLEVYGTLDGAIYSGLTVSFSVKVLTGQDTVDLSNKVIDFSSFIPVGSPIDPVVFIARGEIGEVNLITVGGLQNQGTWQYTQTDLKSIHANNSWSYTNLTNENARKVIENCTEIVFAGMRTTEGETVSTGFLIDDFKWIGLGDEATFPIVESADSIRKYADLRDLKISSTLFHNNTLDWYRDPWYLHTLAQEFNMTSVGSFIPPETKPADISSMEFDYTMADEMVAFAEGHDMFLYGGTGGFNTGNPLWITDGTYEEVKAYLDRKIELDLSHFKGKVVYWGMFNEVMLYNGGFKNRQQVDPLDLLYGSAYAPYGGNYSPFVDGNDTSLIEFAFTKGRSVDPEAKLFLNDYGQERMGEIKSEYFYNFVVDMKNRGVPIDGVGVQLHLMYPDRPGVPENMQVDLSDPEVFFTGIDQNIKRYAEASLFVAFTEFEFQLRLDDIDFSAEAGREEYARRVDMQAQFYARLIQLALDNPNVPFINIWTVADKPGTSGFDWNLFDEEGAALFTFTYTDAFLFDKNYDPKPAYYAVMDLLKP